MGNQMSDKRSARREHAPSFRHAVREIRDGLAGLPPPPPARSASNVSVCIRKRPMLPHEVQRSEYDVVSCVAGERIVVHECRMHADMKRMFVDNHDIAFDRVFGEAVDSEQVYAESAAELVAHALAGGCSTVLMYGQTGTGKTFTMSAIQELAARDLFESGAGAAAVLTAVEVAGSKVHDLFGGRAERTVLQGSNGNVHVRDAVEVEIASAAALMDALRAAAEARATCGTLRNDTSSRSHAIYSLVLQGGARAGRLLLVDLAGSERNIDSQDHDAARRKESAEINTSLMALKDCVRVRARNAARGSADRVPYRGSKLTQLLRYSFSARNSRMLVLATVSPLPQDTEHTLNTLRHACLMETRDVEVRKTTVPVLPIDDVPAEQLSGGGESKQPDYVRPPQREEPMSAWDPDRVRAWGSSVLGGRCARHVDGWPSAFTGRLMSRTTEARWTQLCDGNAADGAALFAAAREELRCQDAAKRERAAANRENNRLRQQRRCST